jgi:hypothetical protein
MAKVARVIIRAGFLSCLLTADRYSIPRFPLLRSAFLAEWRDCWLLEEAT